MKTTNFSKDYGQKLLSAIFMTVRPHDGNDYTLGEHRHISYRHRQMGVVEVVDMTPMRLADIPPHVAYNACCHNAHYFKKLLKSIYLDANDDTLFDVITMRWVKRIPDANMDMWNAEWQMLVEDFYDQMGDAPPADLKLIDKTSEHSLF